MNLRVIIGGLTIIGIAFVFLLPGLFLNEKADLGKITADVVADTINIQSEDLLNKVKDSLNALDAVPYVLFLIGFQTVIVGLLVGYR